MANKKITELPSADALTGSELVELVQGGVNKQSTTQDIADLGGGGGDAVDSVNGQTGVVVLGKSDVGLGNADNTSDANKPVSTAQQTALDLKANLASPTFTGTPAAPTAAAATNTTQLATTAFVQQELANYVNEETFATLTYGATTNWDLNNRQSPLAKLVATGNFAINMTNVKSGCYGTLLITTNVASTVILTFDADFTNKSMILGSALTTWTFPNNNGAEYTCTFYVDGTTIRWYIGDVTTPTNLVPTVKVRRAATQSIPTADLTNPTVFDTEVIDNNNQYSSGSPSIIAAPAGAGNYTADVSIGIDFAAAAGGNVRRGWVYVNGAAVSGAMLESRQPTGGFNASGSTFVSGTVKVECASGDNLTIVPYQDSGSSMNVTVTAYVIFYAR